MAAEILSETSNLVSFNEIVCTLINHYNVHLSRNSDVFNRKLIKLI